MRKWNGSVQGIHKSPKPKNLRDEKLVKFYWNNFESLLNLLWDLAGLTGVKKLFLTPVIKTGFDAANKPNKSNNNRNNGKWWSLKNDKLVLSVWDVAILALLIPILAFLHFFEPIYCTVNKNK